MTNKEFSDRFDVLVSQEPYYLSFNEYEKSVFFTMAQEEIVKEIYESRFEQSERFRKAFPNCIKSYVVQNPKKITNTIGNIRLNKGFEMYSPSETVKLPDDYWFAVMEQAVITKCDKACKNGTAIPVSPVTYDELQNMMKNPFRKPSTNHVSRIDSEGNIKIIGSSDCTISEYNCTYLAKPKPIIFGNLEDGLYICGQNQETETNVDDSIHEEILLRAVAKARAIANV